MGKGRPPKGSEIVTGHDASVSAKKKVILALKTLAGKLSVKDAAAQMGVSESQFHRVRDQLLDGMLAAAEPKPVGRPPEIPDPASEVERRLRARVRELEDELEIAQVREVLALAFPDIAGDDIEERKKKLLERAKAPIPPAPRAQPADGRRMGAALEQGPVADPARGS
jgi:transposase-like protein